MSVATVLPDTLERRAPLDLVCDLRAVFGDLMRLHAEAAGIRADARHTLPHDLDERLAGLAKGLGRAGAGCRPALFRPAATTRRDSVSSGASLPAPDTAWPR